MIDHDKIFSVIALKAKDDANFANAYAILRLTEAVDAAGLSVLKERGYPGALEDIAISLRGIAASLEMLPGAE